MEDPRVFVLATMGRARGAAAPGCEVGISEGEVYFETPAHAWTYVGVEYVAGRPAHHVSCGGELWIDVETRLTLRSRSTAGVGGTSATTIEATRIELGQPPAELFEIRRPAGADVIDEQQNACATSPYCSASPRPVVTPPPAPSGAAPAAKLAAIVAAAAVADRDLPAYEVVVEQSFAKFPGRTTRVLYDGSGRYRVERTNEASPDPPFIVLYAPRSGFASDLSADGAVYWHATSSERGVSYPLHMPEECAGGWQLVGTDLVHNRLADHLACPGAIIPDAYWIDRETHLVLRIESLGDEQTGTQVEEVVSLTFADQPAELFELPPGAVVRP